MSFINMYRNCLRKEIKKDLDNNQLLCDRLSVFKTKFIKWASDQRIIYEADINDEVNEFYEKFIQSRLYSTDVKLWYKIRKFIFERDNFTCCYCNKKGGVLEVDHITPISKGGTNDYVNLTTSCRKCNRQKKDKTVEEFNEWRK